VTVITDEVIRSLAGFKGELAPVTTCYLDVDGRRFFRHQDYEAALDSLLRDVRSRPDLESSVSVDLRHIEEYVRAGLDRSSTRGLAMFSCSAHSMWEAIHLPVPVPNRLVVNECPAVSELEAVLAASEAIGLLLVDRQRVRVFVFELGQLTEHTEAVDELPRDYDTLDARARDTPEHHVEAMVQRHLRHAGEVAWQVYQDRGFEHLAVACPDELSGPLESLLHPYLRDRLCDRLRLLVSASVDDVRTAAVEAEMRVERKREAADVARLRDAAATGRRGVVGLAPTLVALNERRVERLLVSHGYAEEGWRCKESGFLWAIGPASPVSGNAMDRLADVVEEAIESALAQGCRVEICQSNADLDVLGRIGALLRY
jgi:peptide chain release factor subunit 1